MIALLLAVVLSVANAGQDWTIHFSAHSENVGIEIWQRCYVGSKLVWNTVNRVDVEPAWTEVTTHRETRGIPRGASCAADFQVIRNNTDDPNKDYPAPGESAVIDWME